MKKKKRGKTVLIVLLFLALLGAGGVVGVRYILSRQTTSVPVISVSNINGADWMSYYTQTTTSGTVVSDVSQNVRVPEGKVVSEVYVGQGDEVKIGDKLLSFDTTLLELDRESQELAIMELDLEIKSAEADLAKLRTIVPGQPIDLDDGLGLGMDMDMDIPDYDSVGEDDGEDSARLIRADREYRASQDAPADTEKEEAPTETSAPETEKAAEVQAITAPEVTVQTDTQAAEAPQTDTQATETPQTEAFPEGETDTQAMDGADTPGDETQQSGQSETTAESSEAEYVLPEPEMDTSATEPQLPADGIEQPKMNQSLEKLLKNIRVKEITETEEVLLADTKEQEEEPLSVQITENRLKLIPHFAESAEAHFAQLNTYVMLIKGIRLKEDRAGKLYGIAAINGNDYPEIGGYTLKQDTEAEADDVVRLTLAFHSGLQEQHQIDGELEDMYAELELYPEELTGEELIFRTGKKETDRTILLHQPQKPEPESETDEKKKPEGEKTTEQESRPQQSAPETEQVQNQPAGAQTPDDSLDADLEGFPADQTETETETGTEEPEVFPKTNQIDFRVAWYHGTNDQWPQSMSVRFYAQEDTQQTQAVKEVTITGDMEPATEETEENTEGDDRPMEDNSTFGLLQDGETESESETEGVAEGVKGADGQIEYVIDPSENTMSSTRWSKTEDWPEELSTPDMYQIVVTAQDSISYIPRITWEADAERPAVMICNIEMIYLEAEDSPLVKYNPLSELTYQTGEKKRYYKGSGTKEDPFLFFCTDGAVIRSSFVNWVLGFNEAGTERVKETVLDPDGTAREVEREGYYVILEIRESDTITGAFIRSVSLDGTIRMDYGYGPGTYWIFSSDSGIVRYEEEVQEPTTGEPLPEDPGDPGWDDFSQTYTAEELAEAIAERERSLRKLKLSRREAELKLKEYDKELEESTIVSSVNGYVKSMGDTVDSGTYMVVTSQGGLYLRTAVSEMDLDSVKKGDVLTATSWESGSEITASITEISSFPASAEEFYSYGGGNPNASNYPVLAHIEDTSGLSADESVEVRFNQQKSTTGDIYIPVAYVRSENGQSYVYKMGEGGLLKKQYIHTGSTLNDYVEVKDGITAEDMIAFPYGKSVKDGAQTTTENTDDFYY